MILLLVITLAVTCPATSPEMKRGPQCRVERAADEIDQQFVHLYLTPPAADRTYTPGHIRMFLARSWPELNVPLELDRLKDGRLHTKIYIHSTEDKWYTVNVIDEQKPEALLLFAGRISEIPIAGKP